MDLRIWRLTLNIEGETFRSPNAFLTKQEGIKYAVDTAYALARTFQGGKEIAVSRPISPDVNTVVIKLHKDDEAVGELTLSHLTSDDSLVHFKQDHPYVHELLKNKESDNENTYNGAARFG